LRGKVISVTDHSITSGDSRKVLGKMILDTQKLSACATVVAAKNQVSSELAGEAVILNIDRGVYFGLDEIGARVWSLIQQPKTVSAVRDALVQEYEVSPQLCEQDLLSLIANLANEGLVSVSHAAH
jgi:Coenzyme PQQ synthesis protein D (PqqD)